MKYRMDIFKINVFCDFFLFIKVQYHCNWHIYIYMFHIWNIYLYKKLCCIQTLLFFKYDAIPTGIEFYKEKKSINKILFNLNVKYYIKIQQNLNQSCINLYFKKKRGFYSNVKTEVLLSLKKSIKNVMMKRNFQLFSLLLNYVFYQLWNLLVYYDIKVIRRN
jgi:hypothetical protein